MLSKRAISERDAARYELHETLTVGSSESGSKDAESGRMGEDGYGNAGEDEVQTKSNEVTDALRRTTQIMQAELERSVLSVQMLGTSELHKSRMPEQLLVRPKHCYFIARADQHSSAFLHCLAWLSAFPPFTLFSAACLSRLAIRDSRLTRHSLTPH